MCHSEEPKATKPVLSKAKELMRSFTSFRMTLRVRFFASLRMTGKETFSAVRFQIFQFAICNSLHSELITRNR
jgi:hypothetical protein